MDGETPSEPDSTTAERELAADVAAGRQFAVNDDVLCHISRGDQLYLGVVVQVNHVLKKCLVKFLDETETWCCFRDMKQLSVGEQEVTCVVCKSTQPSLGNQLVVCACGRGYHQRCHIPRIPHVPMLDKAWKCRICFPRRRDTKVTPPPKPPPQPQQIAPMQQQECIECGMKDLWYRGMLQCRRCRQWLHGTCLHVTNKRPMLKGDRFYVFVCAGCNSGRELCCRLAVTWADLVHLALFNLNLIQHTKYHDLDLTIMPYLNKLWNTLQLPPEMASTAVGKRRTLVETALQSCSKRFRCGREAKKRVALWGLRMRGAPRPPPVSLPPRGPVDPALLVERRLLKEQPLQNGHINSSRKEEELRDDNDRAGSSSPTTPPPAYAKVESSSEFHGRGLVKRSVPFPLTESVSSADMRFRSQAVRRAARLLRRCTRQPRLSDSEDEALRSLYHPSRTISDYSSDVHDQEKEKEKEVKKRPQRNLLEARLNSTESKLYNPKAAAAAATPAESPGKKKPKKPENVKVNNLRLKTKRKLIQKSNNETPDAADADSNSSADEKERPAPLKTVITKRQLSEKDIMVDRHGVVRRRRRRLLPPKPPPPPPPTSADWGEVLFAGPVDVTLVKDLLGPLPRVERGDPYRVASRRVLPDGQVEVLLAFPS